MRRKILIGSLILIFGILSVLMLTSIAPGEALGQGIFVGVGLIVYVLMQMPRPVFFRRSIPYIGGTTIFLLFLTLLLGRLSHGAVRWLPVGPFHIQMSEFAK